MPKICNKDGCSKYALGKTSFCITHGGGVRCQEPECSKSAQGKTNFCKTHGGGVRCQEPECTKSAQGKTLFCITHGGGVRCQEPECTKSAQGKTNFCAAHGGGFRCQEPECTKSALGKTSFCAAHKGGNRCQEPECTKSASGKTSFCIAHKGGLRCPNCKDWPDSRSGCKKYDGYCATCFKRVFPSDSRSIKIYEKSHEMKVRNYLNEHKSGFIHDTVIYTGQCDCTHRRRIDHRMLIGNTLLCVETDERQHQSYDSKDEEYRYDDLYMIHSGKFIFIRFNPDSYKEKLVRKNPDIKTRLPKLLEMIEMQIHRIESDENTELVEIIKMYYDQ